MIIALFALAIVMIVGGIASVVQGFPFVRLESGLAMTIGGATTASAGAILLGIAVVTLRLRRLERAVAEQGRHGSENAPVPETGPAGRTDTFAREPSTTPVADPAPLRLRPSLAAAGIGTAAAGLGLGLAGLSAGRRGTEPTFEIPAAADETEPLLPDLLPPDLLPHAESEWRPEPPAPMPEPDLQDAAAHEPAPHIITAREAMPHMEPTEHHPVDVPEPVPEPVLDSAADERQPEEAAPQDTPAAAEVPHAAAPDADALHVVGTYASGGNTYVMFSNGSIEADTPRGRFTFSSLDELKVFVESGGESDARGAA